MQKFIISSSLLKPILAKLGQAVNSKTILPALRNIFFKVSAGYAELITSDLELTIIHRCECQLEGEPLEVLLPYDIISHIVAFNPSSPLQFSLEKKSVKISGANDVYEIKKLESPADFPKVPSIPEGNPIDINSAVISLLKTALLTVSNAEPLNGQSTAFTKVLLEVRGLSMTVVSSDMNTVYSCKVDREAKQKPADLLLSPRLIKAIAGATDLILRWNQSHTMFSNGDFTIFFIRPEQKYVAWRTVVPQSAAANLELNRSTLMSALEKCSLNSDDLKNTKVTLGKKNIRFSAVDKEAGLAINVDVEGSYRGSADNITILADKMLKMMHQVGSETVSLAILEKDKAIVLRAKDDENYLGMIMPVAEKV